jgi:hypothetical protein
MSADKHRGIRRQKQKRAKDAKKQPVALPRPSTKVAAKPKAE